MRRAERSEFVKASERRIWRITAVSIVAILGALVATLALIQTRSAVDQINKERAERRAAVNAEIRQLACLLISQTPDDPKRPLIAQFRAKYDCPPYSKANARHPFKTAPSTSAKPTPSPAPTSTRTVTAYLPAAPPVTRTRTVVRTVTVAPGHDKTVTRTVAPTCTLAVDGKCVTLAPLAAPIKPQHGKGHHR